MKKTLLPALALAALLLAPAPALAICEQAGTMVELNRCADEELKGWDGTLNAVYQSLVNILKERKDDRKINQLKIAQRAWIKFRDAEADFATNEHEGGGMGPLSRKLSLAALTEMRVQEIRNHIEGFGDF